MTSHAFGVSVRQALRERGISIRAAARALSYDHAYLSRTLAGRQSPSPQLAADLDAFLRAEGTLVALAAITSTAADEGRIERVISRPSRLDGGAVKVLAGILAAQRRLDDALGPASLIPATQAQAARLRPVLRNARGPHRDALAAVVAEWVQFEGWLHASARLDSAAVPLLTEALELADETDVPALTAQALNFRGYLARQQHRPRAVVRWFLAAYHTPGAHPAQRMGDAAQAAQGYAMLGLDDEARRLLDEASNLHVGDDLPPGTAYWLSPTFQRLNIGLAHLGLREHALAADHLQAGLSGLPADQQSAQWTVEYRTALADAREAA
ncbi:hypothetical protein CP967_31415 [Streptomyces nitrosporeus]|uniref:HTH cro/C1-type domain-containing protein n=1 Tax=Streptomyces nitrosporeus TaxID=28894 RepID=A0A5J6FHP0_9ACTN|nr:helix-turn-helix transcriptional regulator [Streptomyces nitrosporeus]QEU75878.1 hypothetical protein CP967_31415 [Streptomyces nitrosporeus]GGY89072.1 hypothetical protein GCM10010327_19800 [Streptomyces nitrosporeus]